MRAEQLLARHAQRLAALTVAALALGACAPTPTAGPSAKTTPASTIPTPVPAPDATSLPNVADFPEQDTPLAQASVQLQQVWVPYGVTIIPSRHVLDHMPALPVVLNKTNGALSDAQVQQMGLAYYRTGALWGWADAHDEMKFQV